MRTVVSWQYNNVEDAQEKQRMDTNKGVCQKLNNFLTQNLS